MEIKLKKCPFCGGTAKLKERGCGHDVVAAYILCEGCGASSEEFNYGYMSGCHREAFDAAAKAWNKRAEEKAQEQQRITKSSFFKINPYREHVFGAPLESWFAAVEAALGYKLFFWQKTYIEMGVFRQYGETTAKILRELSQVNEPPLDLVKYRIRGHKERWFCEELLKVKNVLDAAGVPTREVLLTVRDEREYLRRKEAVESLKAIPQGGLEGLRAMGRFWDV